MNHTSIYLLQVNLGIVFFYLFYRLFFATDTFWKTRRIYLLASIGASFAYPLLSIENWLSRPDPVQTALIRISTLPEITILPTQQVNTFNVEMFLLVLYLIISAGLFIYLLLQQMNILRIRYFGKKKYLQGIQIISVDKNMSPFSYFGDIYINPDLHTEEEIREILAHESAHVRQLHSIDVILFELLKIFFWINPAVWLLKREVRQNLEFLADNKVLTAGFDSKKYQYHLLQLSFQTPDVKIGNQFNVSPLKKRIIMMNKKNSNRTALLKYMLIIPLVLALVISSNAQQVIRKASKVASTAIQSVEKISSENSSAIQSPLKEDVVVVQSKENQSEEIFQVVEKMPEYVGGNQALYSFIAKNVRYPVAAMEANVEGVVLVRFVVNKEGKAVNAEVVKTMELNPDKNKDNQKSVTVVGYASNDSIKNVETEKGLKALENESKRVVSLMDAWIPGEQKGQKVSVYFVLPINFRLNGNKSSQKTESTLNGTVPMYLIDDKPASKSEVDALKPENIQEVSVLKNEAATKIYGEKGKNGVVLIKMKK